ncbi:ABC transporter ATP-binding domain-containing protein (plasmid) [Rhizobium sp. CIAT894]|nr:ABC transporter ATP-binding domain-containing protein [Rhizobium sp. CIAT894]
MGFGDSTTMVAGTPSAILQTSKTKLPDFGGEHIPLGRDETHRAYPANRPLTLGIRPEDIAFGGETGIDAVVKVVEPTGSETHVAVEVDGRELTWVVRERVELVPEQRVKFSFETSKVHFFDQQTQQRLSA